MAKYILNGGDGVFSVNGFGYTSSEHRMYAFANLVSITPIANPENYILNNVHFSDICYPNGNPYSSVEDVVNDYDDWGEVSSGDIMGQSTFKVTYYEIIDISAATSGSLQASPQGATIQEGEFGESGNSILSKLNTSSKPSYSSPVDGVGDPITVNLDTNGDWMASDTFSDPVALIYSITLSGEDWGNLDLDKKVDFYQTSEVPFVLYEVTSDIQFPSTSALSKSQIHRVQNRSGESWELTTTGSDTIEGEDSFILKNGETLDLTITANDFRA